MEHLRSPTGPTVLTQWMRVLPWPVHLLDPHEHGEPTTPNPMLTQLLGYLDSELDRSTFRERLSDYSREHLRAKIEELERESRDFVETSLIYIHRNGREIDVPRVRIGRLYEDGPFFVMLVRVASPTFMDRAQLQSRLTRLISHDLNNIFTISQSYIDLIQRQRPAPDQRKDYLDRSMRAIRRGVHLNELLHTLMADPNLPPEECFIDEIIAPLEPLIGRLLSPGPRWKYDLESEMPLLHSHPVELTRFIFDLCINAFMRWPHAEELHLEARPAPGESRASLLRICPEHGDRQALPVPFQLFLSQDVHLHDEEEDGGEPCQIENILNKQPISVFRSEEALVAYLPAPQEN